MENRSGGNGGRLEPQHLAESIWHSLSETEKGLPVAEWIESEFHGAEIVEIPEGRPEALGAGDMFSPSAVIFRADKDTHQITYSNPEQAELVSELARLGIRDLVAVPKTPSDCGDCLKQLGARTEAAQERFTELTALRTGTASLQDKVLALLMHWYIQGK